MSWSEGWRHASETGMIPPSCIGQEAFALRVHAVHVQLLRNLMAIGAQSGLNVMRTWAQGVDPMFALQTSPGVYNEEIFTGLDYALDQARQHNIKVSAAT